MMKKESKQDVKREYEKKHFKYQNVCFKSEEMEKIETYCKRYGVAKNALIREAVMEFIKYPYI